MKSSVANILLVFTVAYAAISVAAVVIAVLWDTQFGPRYDSMFRLAAVFAGLEIFLSREKKTLEKWEFHAVAIGSVLIALVVSPLTLLLAVDSGELARLISEPLMKGPLSVAVGAFAFIIGIQYFMTYWAARFWAWSHFRAIANAKAIRR